MALCWSRHHPTINVPWCLYLQLQCRTCEASMEAADLLFKSFWLRLNAMIWCKVNRVNFDAGWWEGKYWKIIGPSISTAHSSVRMMFDDIKGEEPSALCWLNLNIESTQRVECSLCESIDVALRHGSLNGLKASIREIIFHRSFNAFLSDWIGEFHGALQTSNHDDLFRFQKGLNH